MSSPQEEKERLRSERLDAERAESGAARRQRRIQLLSGAGFLGICVVVALVIISQSGSGNGGDATIEDAGLVAAELKGIPQNGTVIGRDSAKVKVTEFADLQCPFCREFAVSTAPELIDDPVRRGEARYELRQWTILGPDSETAAKAALAAGEQGRYWNFVELFYRNQGTENSGYVTGGFLTAVAEGAGVPDINAWNASRADPKWNATLSGNDAAAKSLGFGGTPSLMVEGPGGRKLFDSIPSRAEIEGAIADLG